MSEQPTKYVIKDNRIYFSAREAYRILNQLADGVRPFANPEIVLRRAADLFVQIEHDGLEMISNEFPTQD